MSNNNSSTASVNIGFPGLLTLLFIGLKLTGHIAWLLVWALSPLWISLSLVLLIAGIFVILAVISGAYK